MNRRLWKWLRPKQDVPMSMVSSSEFWLAYLCPLTICIINTSMTLLYTYPSTHWSTWNCIAQCQEPGTHTDTQQTMRGWYKIYKCRSSRSQVHLWTSGVQWEGGVHLETLLFRLSHHWSRRLSVEPLNTDVTKHRKRMEGKSRVPSGEGDPVEIYRETQEARWEAGRLAIADLNRTNKEQCKNKATQNITEYKKR